MRVWALLAAFAILGAVQALGQGSNQSGQQVITNPVNTGPGGTVLTGGTVTSTAALALASNSNRRGCLIQNQGTHNMNIGVSSGMAFPIILAANQTMNCQVGVMSIGDPIWISGTASDAYVIWWQ